MKGRAARPFTRETKKRPGVPPLQYERALPLSAGETTWLCGFGGRETSIRLSPEEIAEAAFCHRLSDPKPTQRRRRIRR